MDGSGFRRMVSSEMRVNDIHNPLSMGYPVGSGDSYGQENAGFRGVSSFKDDLPPVTLITSAVRSGNLVRVHGSVADTSGIRKVLVNNQPARSIRDHYSEWEITLEAPVGKPLDLTAVSEDASGLVEKHPHKVRVE